MMAEGVLRDVRLACRLLWLQPAWTTAAILCLGIATGANTAAFSIVNGILLRPLPFPEAAQLSMVALQDRESGQTRPFALAEYRSLVSASPAGIDLATWSFLPVSISTASGTDIAEGQLVSGNYFEVLRVRPAAGRFFDAHADQPGAPAEVVISDRLWRTRFSEDPAIVGRALRVGGQAMVVSAVAPAGFVGAMGLIAPDLWLPAQHLVALTRNADAERQPLFGGVGRRLTGVSPAQATVALDAGLQAGLRSILEPASGFGVPPGIRKQLPAAMAVVFTLAALVVVVAAANVASLVLARGTHRVSEMGVRLALGASRGRVARQLLTESLVLSLAGSALGLVLSYLATWFLQPEQSAFDYVSYAVQITPDLRVFAFAVAGAIVTALVFGVAPAFSASRTNLVAVLRPTAGAGRSPRTTRWFNALVTAQIAVCSILLIASGLLGRSYVNARSVDVGLDVEDVVAVALDLDHVGPMDEPAARRLAGALSDRIAAIAGVERVSLTRESPVATAGQAGQVWAADGPLATDRRLVSAGHFTVLRMPFLEGMVFTGRDGGQREVVVNDAMARLVRPSGSAVGQVIHFDRDRRDSAVVVGVVRDGRTRAGAQQPTVYESFEQRFSPRLTLLVHSTVAPVEVSASIRAAVVDVNPDLPVLHVRTLRDERERALAPRRRAASLVGAVGGIGLLLAAIGLYGVTSFGIRSRIREFGIRIALGATSRHLRAEVLGRGLRTVGLGLAIGIALSLVVTRFIAGVLLGVEPHDWPTLGGVTVVLTVVAVTALLLPLRVVRSVEPTVALRQD